MLFHRHPSNNHLNRILFHCKRSLNAVQLKVQATSVTHRFTYLISPPQRCSGSLTISALQSLTSGRVLLRNSNTFSKISKGIKYFVLHFVQLWQAHTHTHWMLKLSCFFFLEKNSKHAQASSHSTGSQPDRKSVSSLFLLFMNEQQINKLVSISCYKQSVISVGRL